MQGRMATQSSPPRDRLAWLGGLEPLWVIGLLFLQLQVVGRFIDATSRRGQLAHYVLLGTLFPSLVLLLCVVKPQGRSATVLGILKAALAGYALWVAAWPIWKGASAPILVIAAVHWMVATMWQASHLRRDGAYLLLTIRFRPEEGRRWKSLADSAVNLLVILTSWVLAARLFWWVPFETFMSTSIYPPLVLAGSLVLVALNVLGRQQPLEHPRTRSRYLGDVLALVLIGLLSTRVDSLGGVPQVRIANGFSGTYVFHHWGVVVGPAELVRQGGWLLWDVPAQYGFLSTLLLAWLPVGSVWQSLYLVQATLVFLSGAILYLMLRSLRTGRANLGFSLALTLAAVHLIGGLPHILSGPYIHPPLGAYRFFWAYALLAILYWGYQGDAASMRFRRILLGGCITWVLGSLWSAESATYSSAIWLPAFSLLVMRRASALQPDPAARVARFRLAAAWLVLPPALLLTVLGMISGYYLFRLGHGPDWYAYIDYMSSFTTGYFSRLMDRIPVKPQGAVGALMVLFCALTMLAVEMIRQRRGLAPLALVAGTWGALWACSSYFALRGVDHFVTSLSPLLCAYIAVMLAMVVRHPVDGWLTSKLRLALMPILVVLLTMGFGNRDRLPDWTATLRRGYVRRVERLLPMMDPALKSLLDQARVRSTDRISYIDVEPLYVLNHLPVWPTRDFRRIKWRNRSWLPTMPYALLLTLPEERGRLYIRRFAARVQSGGWLIRPKKFPPIFMPWFFDALSRSYIPAQSFENEAWTLTRYEPRVEMASRPAGRPPLR